MDNWMGKFCDDLWYNFNLGNDKMNFWFRIATIQLAIMCAFYIIFKIDDYLQNRSIQMIGKLNKMVSKEGIQLRCWDCLRHTPDEKLFASNSLHMIVCETCFENYPPDVAEKFFSLEGIK